MSGCACAPVKIAGGHYVLPHSSGRGWLLATALGLTGAVRRKLRAQ
jgi:hypothetical protein